LTDKDYTPFFRQAQIGAIGGLLLGRQSALPPEGDTFSDLWYTGRVPDAESPGYQLPGMEGEAGRKEISMAKSTGIVCGLWLLFVLAAAVAAAGPGPQAVQPIFDGPELDYQPSIVRVQPGGQLMVVFERIDLTSFFGDLYVTFSGDGGETWSVPAAIIATPLNERHPSLLQLAADSFVLFYLVDESGSGAYRLHRATSSDGVTWTDQGALHLGWDTPGEINPNVIREADGTLTMTYHRLSGPSYIARSTDDGATWDTLKTQVSDGNAALPRLAKRESDGLYLVTYQVNPGGNNLDLYAKVSTDPYDWTGPQIPVSTAINTHDSQPIVLQDGTFLVAYAMTPVSYFDIFYRTSCDGVSWSDEVQVTHDASRYDTQPHPLPHETLGRVILTWSHQDGDTPYQDHDVWIDTGLEVLRPPSKSAAPMVVGTNDLLTYTLQIPNDRPCAQTGSLFDPIPANTCYVAGSLWASSGNPSYDPVECVINWTGVISAGEAVTITFQVSTSASLEDGAVVTNKAWLNVGQSAGYTLVATTTADVLLPTSVILEPQEGQFISDTTYLLRGVATDTVSGVSEVAVSVDGGPWQAAEGQASWTYLWEAYDEGAHNLRGRATDAAGHVEEPGPGVTVTVDSTPPELVAFSPVSGAIGVSLTVPVVLQFSEPVLHDTLTYSVTPDPGGWLVLWNVGSTEATLYHDSLLPGQTYTVIVNQARDRARNPLAPVQWTFATVPAEEHHHVYLPLVVKGE
jgi:hypothetical protein